MTLTSRAIRLRVPTVMLERHRDGVAAGVDHRVVPILRDVHGIAGAGDALERSAVRAGERAASGSPACSYS